MSPLRRQRQIQRRTPLRAAKPERWRCDDCGAEREGSTCEVCGSSGLPEILTGRAPIKPVSDKRRAENKLRRAAMLDAFGPEPLCAIHWDSNCRGRADSVHEIRKRSAGGSITDPANAVPACNYCNGMVEDHPLEARRLGWVKRGAS